MRRVSQLDCVEYLRIITRRADLAIHVIPCGLACRLRRAYDLVWPDVPWLETPKLRMHAWDFFWPVTLFCGTVQWLLIAR